MDGARAGGGHKLQRPSKVCSGCGDGGFENIFDFPSGSGFLNPKP